MAARKTKRIDQKSRDKIQASQLINRLMKHALADEEIMTSSQVRAAEMLLRKTLPDLKLIEHTGGSDNSLRVTVVYE